MRPLSWALIAAAVVAAFPFGWGLGVLAAYPMVGVFPVLTIIPGIIGAIAFALSPVLTAGMRLLILIIGTGLLILVGRCC